MLSSFLSLALSAFVLGQAEAPVDAKQQQEAIAKAVIRLGDKQFAVREAAGRFLWQQGEAAEAALKLAAQSPDREVRTRAKRILVDFESGIRPATSPAEIAWLRDFRDGDANLQLKVLTEIAANERFDVLGRLLRQTPVPDVRQQLLLMVSQNAEAAEKLVVKGRIEKLAEKIGEDQAETWRQTLVRNFYFSPQVLKLLTENERTAEYLALLEKEKDLQARRQMIQAMLMNPAVVKAHLEQKKLDALLGLIVLETDKNMRSALLSSLIFNPAFGTAIIEQGQFAAILKFTREHLEADGRASLLEQASHHAKLVQDLLDKFGADRLLKLLAEEKDDGARGKILGAWVSNQVVWQRLHQEQPTRWLTFAQEQTSVATRRAYLQKIIERGMLFRNREDQEALDALWTIIRADDNRDWQLTVAAQLFNFQNGQKQFANAKDRLWLLELLKGEPTAERIAFLQRVLSQQIYGNGLVDDGHFDALLVIVKGVPDAQRGTMLGQVIGLTSSLRQLQTAKRLGLVLTLWREEKNADAQAQYLKQIAANANVVKALTDLDAGAELIATVRGLADPKTKAELWAALFRHPVILNQWLEKKQLDEILAIGRDAPDDETRRAYCRQLFQIPHALQTLADNGRFEPLVELWRMEPQKSQRVELLSHLLTAPKLAALLLKDKLGTEVVTLIDDDAVPLETRRQCFQRILQNPVSIAAFAEGGHVEKLFSWAKLANQKYERAAFVGSLISNPAVIKNLMAAKNFDSVLEESLKDFEQQLRRQVLQNLLFNEQTLQLLVSGQHTEKLLATIAKLQEPDLLFQFISRPTVVKELETQKRLGIILDLAKDFPATEPPRPGFAQMLFGNSTALGALFRNGFADKVVALIDAEPNSAIRPQLITTIIASGTGRPEFQKPIQENKLVEKLLAFAQQDKDPSIRVAARRAIFGNPTLVHHLISAHFDTLLKLAQEAETAEQQGLFIAQFMTAPQAIDLIIKKGLLQELWQKVQAGNLPINELVQIQLALAQNGPAVQALIENDQFDGLLAFMRRGEKQNRSTYPFYAQPRVVRHIVTKQSAAAYWKLVNDDIEKNMQPSFFQMLSYNDEALTILLEHDQLQPLLELAKQSGTQNRSERLQEQILSRPAVVKWMIDKKKFSEVLAQLKPKSDDANFGSYFQNMLFSQPVRNALNDAAMRDELWKLATTENNPAIRKQFFQLLFSEQKVIGWVLKENNFDALVTAVKPPDVLFTNPMMLTALIEAGHFEALWRLVAATTDATERAALGGQLLVAPTAIPLLKKSGRLEDVWKLISASDANSPAMQTIRVRLLRDVAAVGELIEKGHFDSLAEWSIKTTGRQVPGQASSWTQLLANPSTVKHLIAKRGAAEFVKIIAAETDEQVRSDTAIALCIQPESCALLIEHQQIGASLDLVKVPKASIRSFMGVNGVNIPYHPLSQMFANPTTVKLLAEKKQLGVLLKLVSNEPDDSLRHSLAHQLVGYSFSSTRQSPTISALIENGHLDELWKRATSDPHEPIRNLLLPAVISHPQTVSWLTKDKDLDAVLKTFDKDEVLFASLPLLTVLVKDGRFEALWKRAISSTDTKRRGLYAVRLVNSPSGLEQFKQHDRWEELWKIVAASELSAADVREAATVLTSNGVVLDALLEKGHLDALVAWSLAAKGSGTWMGLVSNPKIVRAKVKKDGAAEFLKWLNAATANERSTALTLTANHPESIVLLIEGGQFDELLKIIQSPEMRGNREYMLGRLNQIPKAAAELAKRNDIKLPAAVMRDARENQQALLIQLQQDPVRLKAWLKDSSLADLLKLADDGKLPNRKPTAKQQLLVSPALVAVFAEQEQLKALLEEIRKEKNWDWHAAFLLNFFSNYRASESLSKPAVAQTVASVVKEEPNAEQRSQHAASLVSNPAIRQSLLAAGNEGLLRELLPLVTNQLQREAIEKQLQYSVSGLLGHHLLHDNFEAAEKLMRGETDELSRTRWISYLTVRKQLAEEIKTLEAAYAKATHAPADVRMLLRLHRANGDLEAAKKFVQDPTDVNLLHSLISESRNWPAAVQAVSRALSELPAAIPADDPTVVERLGYLAAYQRLAGAQDESQATLKKIRAATENTKSPAVQWQVAKILLLNEQWEAGLALLEKVDQPKAFSLRCLRREYGLALKLVGAEAGATFDHDWLEKILLVPKQPTWPTLTKHEFALEVFKTLKQLGRAEDAEKILTTLETEFEKNPKVKNSVSGNDPYVKLVFAITRAAGAERGAKLMQSSLSDLQAHVVSRQLRPQADADFALWDFWFRMQTPTSTFGERWLEMNRLLDGRFSTEEFERLVASVEAHGQRTSTSQSITTSQFNFHALGRAYLSYGRPEDARRCFEKVGQHNRLTAVDLVETLFKLKDWPAVARHAEAAFEKDHNQILMLFLAGAAAQRAGEKDRGERLKQQASLLSFDSRLRHQMAVELNRFGLRDDALAQHQLVLKVAPVDSWEWHDSLRLIGDLRMTTEPTQAADDWEQFQLNNLQSIRYLLNPEFYLRLPILIGLPRAKAAVESGDLPRANAEILKLHAAHPAASSIAETLVPVFEKAGQAENAKSLFDRHFQQLKTTCTNFPKSATAHNELAWLAARCQRELDEALKHAELAVQLAPLVSHLDTLAEVHFQRGDREAALQQSRRALELEPQNRTHQDRLKHFETAPIK